MQLPKINQIKSKPKLTVVQDSEPEIAKIKYDSLPSLHLPDYQHKKAKTPTVRTGVSKKKDHKPNAKNIKMLKKLNQKRKGKKPPLVEKPEKLDHARAKSNPKGKNKKESPPKLKIVEKDPWDGNFNSVDYKDHSKEPFKKKRKS